MIYLDPVFKDDELNNYYKNNHDAQSKYPKMKEIFTIECLVQDFLLLKDQKKNNNLLDIGCSNGLFLDLVKKIRFKRMELS